MTDRNGMQSSLFSAWLQTVFAVHWEEQKRYHIHFTVSTINYLNGRKWHTSLSEIKQREEIFNNILLNHQRQMSGKQVILFYGEQVKKII